jgi:hypothetical protein
MENSVHKETFGMGASVILLGLAILVFPHQFLFSKFVPNSFWTAYFPLPFGAGWFITFIALLPVVWLNKSVAGAVKSAISGLFLVICMTVPIALLMIGGSLSPHNLLSQYLWVSMICAPPLLLQIVLKWLYYLYANNR